MRFQLDIKSTTFLLFFISLVTLAVINYLAIELFLYWQYLWLDIPMHFLGGVVVALGFLVVFPLHKRQTVSPGVWWSMLFVFFVGVLWELIEYSAGIALVGSSERIPDTVLDLVMDLAGGIIGFYVARSLNILDEATKEDDQPTTTSHLQP